MTSGAAISIECTTRGGRIRKYFLLLFIFCLLLRGKLSVLVLFWFFINSRNVQFWDYRFQLIEYWNESCRVVSLSCSCSCFVLYWSHWDFVVLARSHVFMSFIDGSGYFLSTVRAYRLMSISMLGKNGI